MEIIKLSIPLFVLYFGAKKWHFRCLTQNPKTTIIVQAYPNVAHGTFKSSMYPPPHLQTIKHQTILRGRCLKKRLAPNQWIYILAPYSRFPLCVLLTLSWKQMKIQIQISWVGQSTRLPAAKLGSAPLWLQRNCPCISFDALATPDTAFRFRS